MAHNTLTRSDWLRFGSLLLVIVGVLILLYPFWPLDEAGILLGLNLQGEVQLVLEPEGLDVMTSAQQRDTIDRIITILNKRVDQYGLANIEIKQVGATHILVNLPETSNLEEVRRLIGQMGILQFHRVIEKGSRPDVDLVPTSAFQELFYDRDGIPYIVESEPLLTGAALDGVRTFVGDLGELEIALGFTREGAEQLVSTLHKSQIGEQLAIVLDGTIYNTPLISQDMKDIAQEGNWRAVNGLITITGHSSQAEAVRIAVVLTTGALPTSVDFVEENIFSPKVSNVEQMPVEISALNKNTSIGKYSNPLNPDDCLEINSDGTCYMAILGFNAGTIGRWKLENGRISLLFPAGTTFRGKVITDAIILEGFGALPVVWIKSTKSLPQRLDLVGKYVKEDHSDEYLMLNVDGTYTKTERGMGGQLWNSSGEWELDGQAVTFFYLGDRTSEVTVAVLKNRLYFTGLFGTDIWIGEPCEELSPKGVSLVRALREPAEKTVSDGREPPGVEWERIFSNSDADHAITAKQTDDGGYIILANSTSKVNDYAIPVIWLIKTDKAGNKEWERFYGGLEDGCEAWGNCVRQTRDGGFIVVGAAEVDQALGAWLIKIGARGEKEWARMLGKTSEGYAEGLGTCVQQTEDGGYIVVGETGLYEEQGDVWLVKTDDVGNFVWDKTFGGPWRDFGWSIDQTADGGYIINGVTWLGSDWGTLQSAIWLVRTDSSGEKEWEQFYGGDASGTCRILATKDGGFVLVSNKDDYSDNINAPWLWLVALESDGSTAWEVSFDEIAEDASTWITESPNGGYAICTSKENLELGFPASVLWLLRTDELGNIRWTLELDRSSFGASVESTTDGGYIVLGTSLDDAAGDDVWLLKLSPDQVALEISNADDALDQTVADAEEVTVETGFWAEVLNAPYGRWSIRQSPGVSDEDVVLKRVPNGWVLRVKDTYSDEVNEDGYIWWEVEDNTEGLSGWMAAKEVHGDQRFLVGETQDGTRQQELAARVDSSLVDIRQERASVVREAVEHYLSNTDDAQSLYSSDDNDRNGDPNNLSLLAQRAFPLEVILAIAAQETGGTAYSNLGDGVMQVDYEKSKGLASNIECASTESRYYSNTRQSIYANVKDGLRVLRDFFAGASGADNAAVIATWKYNGGVYPKQTYCRCQGDPFYLAHVGIRLSGNDLLENNHTCKGCIFLCLECSEMNCTKNGRPCGYSPTPTIEDFDLALSPSLSIPFKEYQVNNVSGSTCSSAELRIRDSHGRITGILDDVPVEEIPHSACAQGVPIVFLPEDTYEYEAVGQRDGQYALVLSSVESGNRVTFTATSMPIQNGTIHNYAVNWETLARGEDGVTLMVDQDGDGKFETKFLTGPDLDGTDLPLPATLQPTVQGTRPWLYVLLGVVMGIVVTAGVVLLVFRNLRATN
jgi:hypothetical protein